MRIDEEVTSEIATLTKRLAELNKVGDRSIGGDGAKPVSEMLADS